MNFERIREYSHLPTVEVKNFVHIQNLFMVNLGEAFRLLNELFSTSDLRRIVEEYPDDAQKITRILEARNIKNKGLSIEDRIEIYIEHLDEQLIKIQTYIDKHHVPSTSLFANSTLGRSNAQHSHYDMPFFGEAQLMAYNATRHDIVCALKENKTKSVLPREKIVINSLIDAINKILKQIHDYYRITKKNELPNITDKTLETATANMAKENHIELLDDSLKF
jgi:hypothetical protein